MRCLLPFLLVLGLAAGEAGGPVDAATDAYALKAGEAEVVSVVALGAYLKGVSATPRDRARAVFRWMAEHIAYGNGPTDPAGVLKARQTSCGGYAALYQALCEQVEVPCRVIVGQIKHHGSLRGHAWNAIEVDGAWRLVDSTWGAGSIGPEGYRKRFEPGYFMADPEVMKTSHFPTDPRWQLLETPIDRDAFMRLPRLLPAFGTAGLVLESHLENPVTAKGEVTITFRRTVSDAARLTPLLCLGVQALPRGYVLAVNEEDRVTVRVATPGPGTYTLWLLVDGAFAGTYEIVQTDRAREVRPDFPQFFGTYHESGIELLEPLAGSLPRGKQVTFRVRGGGGRAKVIAGGRPVVLRRVGRTDEYRATVIVPAGELYLVLPGRRALDWDVLAGFNLKQ